MSIVLTAKDQSTADAMVNATAQSFGVTDMERARNSPQVLVGTIDQVKRELSWRIENFGMTYFFLNFIMPDMAELFAREIMPAFA
jgi:hypothetical protein